MDLYSKHIEIWTKNWPFIDKDEKLIKQFALMSFCAYYSEQQIIDISKNLKQMHEKEISNRTHILSLI